MDRYDLVIIGSGASGLMAGITALNEGIKKVLLLEREEDLGGNLNLFIHNGFGEFYLGEKVTGPELASFLIEDYKALGGIAMTNTKVLSVNNDKIITMINPEMGVVDIEAGTIVFATGCREKFTGNIMVPIDKYTGIFTTASAHRLINFKGYRPGKKVVIQANGVWSFLLARRLIIEGAEIKALVTNADKLTDEEKSAIDGFNIPIIYNGHIQEIGGEERIEYATIKIGDNEEVLMECDSLILSVGYYPEVELIRGLEVNIDTINTIEDGFFACGTVKQGINGLFNSGEDGYIIGHLSSQYIKKYLY